MALSEAQIEQRRNAGKARAEKAGSAGMAALGSLGYAALVAKHGTSIAIKVLAKAMKGKPSSPERWLYDELNNLGIQYDTQLIVDDRYIIDAGHKGHKWVIEIDGWRYAEKPFGIADRNFMAELEAKLEYLRSIGYRTLYLRWDDGPKLNRSKINQFLHGNH